MLKDLSKTKSPFFGVYAKLRGRTLPHCGKESCNKTCTAQNVLAERSWGFQVLHNSSIIHSANVWIVTHVGSWAFSIPKGSMYGTFTYIYHRRRAFMEVNMPVRWILWVSLSTGRHLLKYRFCSNPGIPRIGFLQSTWSTNCFNGGYI